LSFAAIVALALGLFQDFGPSHQPGEARVDWVEGVAIMVAVFIVVRFFSLYSSSQIDSIVAWNDRWWWGL
jgi:P-type Ca2+ transporter type 2C